MTTSSAPESAALEMLTAAGFTVAIRSSTDLNVSKGSTAFTVEVKSLRSATYEWDARHLLRSATGDVLVVVPRASQSLVTVALENPRLSVASVDDRHLVWRGESIVLQHSSTTQRRVASRRSPWGRWALMRVLALSEVPQSQVALSRQSGISQPGVSQALTSLSEWVERERHGWRATDRSALWDHFLDSYAGAGGIPTYWYGLDAVAVQSDKAANVAREANVEVLRSGDVAADTLAPWRVPRRAVLYAREGLALKRYGFAESRFDDATLEVVVPVDHTIWATAHASARAGLVDPVIAAWDMLRTGGPDAPEAAARLKAITCAQPSPQ